MQPLEILCGAGDRVIIENFESLRKRDLFAIMDMKSLPFAPARLPGFFFLYLIAHHQGPG